MESSSSPYLDYRKMRRDPTLFLGGTILGLNHTLNRGSLLENSLEGILVGATVFLFFLRAHTDNVYHDRYVREQQTSANPSCLYLNTTFFSDVARFGAGILTAAAVTGKLFP